MLAYNRKKLDTWLNRKMTEDAANLGLISETEKHNILARYPSPFFSPRTVMRVGLGFATMVAVGMFFSFIQMVLGINIGDYITHLLFGSAVIVLLEHMIRKKDHYRSGIDDMLLYEGFGIIMAGIISVFDKMPDPSVILSGAAVVLALIATLRYADRLMAALTLLAFILFAYFVVIKIDRHLWAALPLAGMMVSLAAWFGAFKFIHHPRVLYYRHCLEFLQLVSLVVLGVSTNYFVADTWFLDHQQDLSGFWKGFYITTTVAVPLVTIGTGLPGRDKKRIRIGALMVVAAVMTFHHYLTTTPVETLCILYGSLLLIVSYWLLRFHKARENGISFSEKQDSRELFDIESLAISAGVSMIIPEAASQRYGGGDFGGAGSGGKF